MEFLKAYCKLRCCDIDILQKKIHSFLLDGPEHLMVIADFDYTLSKNKTDDGKKCAITYDVFKEEADRTSPLEAKRFTELGEKYYPIEVNPNIPVSEKIPHMIHWWEESNKLILSKKYSKDRIKESGVDIFLRNLEKNNIPLVIFSAGIGDVIKLCLKSKIGVVYSNIHILSNMFIYNEADIIYGFSTPLIHTYCKDGTMIEKCPALKRKLTGRYNVLLMGDSLGDVTMADGYSPNIGKVNVLKLGFLNDPQEGDLRSYCDAYDTVLVDDNTVEIPIQIIKYICNRKELSV